MTEIDTIAKAPISAMAARRIQKEIMGTQLSKNERKGKTPREIHQLRVKKWAHAHGYEKYLQEHEAKAMQHCMGK